MKIPFSFPVFSSKTLTFLPRASSVQRGSSTSLDADVAILTSTVVRVPIKLMMLRRVGFLLELEVASGDLRYSGLFE